MSNLNDFSIGIKFKFASANRVLACLIQVIKYTCGGKIIYFITSGFSHMN